MLLERLIVNRPHPWGLLITFIELIKVSLFALKYFYDCFTSDLNKTKNILSLRMFVSMDVDLEYT